MSEFPKLALAVATVAMVACGRGLWESLEVPEGVELQDVLDLDIYAPFDRDSLLADPEAVYGEPKAHGSESKGKDYVFYKEYVGKHGRIRAYDETIIDEEGFSARWLELYPGGLYIEDVVKQPYLRQLPVRDGRWKLSIQPPSRRWHVTLEFDDGAVLTINDLPP